MHLKLENSKIAVVSFQALEVFAFGDSLDPFVVVAPLERCNFPVHSFVGLVDLAFDPLVRLVATHEEAKKETHYRFYQVFYFISLPATTVTYFELNQRMKQDIRDYDEVLADAVEIHSLFPYSENPV